MVAPGDEIMSDIGMRAVAIDCRFLVKEVFCNATIIDYDRGSVTKPKRKDRTVFLGPFCEPVGLFSKHGYPQRLKSLSYWKCTPNFGSWWRFPMMGRVGGPITPDEHNQDKQRKYAYLEGNGDLSERWGRRYRCFQARRHRRPKELELTAWPMAILDEPKDTPLSTHEDWGEVQISSILGGVRA